jgi:aspartate kinase
MNAPVVLKFGGASLATPRRVRVAAERIAFHRRSGVPVVAVVSAQGSTTDRILAGFGGTRGTGASEGAGPGPTPAAVPARDPAAREVDRALATGEDHAAALLAALLCRGGILARSLRGGEAGIQADGGFGEGRPRRVDPAPLRALLRVGIVPVVSGFQATRADGETITLGRGGSDLTAVLLAAEFGATECLLVKDVSGIFDRDPAATPGAVLQPRLTYSDAVALARAGASVLQLEAAELAATRGVPLRVLHYADPFGAPAGTLVQDPDHARSRARTPATLEAS